MIIKRRNSIESDEESQPLVSSTSSSIGSFGSTHNQFFNDSETTDYEAEKVSKANLANLQFSPKQIYMRPFCFPGGDESPPIEIYAYQHQDKTFEQLNYLAKFNSLLNISTSSVLPKNSGCDENYENLNVKTQSSLVTIFAIWNTIMGSSLLSMPWGFEKAGLFPGIFLNIALAGICLYTCYILLSVNRDHGLNEVSELCQVLLGKWAEILAKIFSPVVLIGANIVYWVLMSNFFYHSVSFFYGHVLSLHNTTSSNETVLCPKDHAHLNFTSHVQLKIAPLGIEKVWDLYSTVPVIVGFFMFPLLNFKSVTFFTKFNSLGTVSVMYLLIFVAVKSIGWGVNMTNWNIEFHLKSTFCALSGMLSLSYFIHNIIICVMRNNRYQNKNGRDLSIAFGLVTFTYLFIGVAFYICFPLAKSCIEDNILNNFEKYDTMTIIARLLLLFQLFTVFPLMSYMLRLDVLNNIRAFGRNWSGEFSYKKVIIINLILVFVCICFACFLPRIGTLIRYTGAISGMIYIFLLPSLLKIASLRKNRLLTPFKLLFHILIIVFGLLNLFSQFFIND